MSTKMVYDPSQSSVKPAVSPQSSAGKESAWVPDLPPSSDELIFDDGEPLESNRHRIAMNVLIRSLKYHWRERQDYFAGGNMFIYYSTRQVRNQDFRGPDFFVVLDTPHNPSRQGWVVWEEEGRYPDVIIELLSQSTAAVDRGPKKELYAQVFKTRDYFIYDPFAPDAFQGWTLDLSQGYRELVPNEQGYLRSDALGLWLGHWHGLIEDDETTWLRFFDEGGHLVLLPEEAAQQQAEQAQQQVEQAQQQVEQERQQREALLAKLRERGIDPDSL